MEDYLGWIFLFLLFFGGSIAVGWNRLMDVFAQLAGRPKSLSPKTVRALQQERDSAFDLLREIQAYDKYAVNPLTTELSEKLNEVLNTKKTPQIEKRQDT